MKKLIILFFVFVLSQLNAQNPEPLYNLKMQIDSNEHNLTEKNNFSIQKKKPGLALIYSLILPGMGELYTDNYDVGKYFTIVDLSLWGVLTGINIYAKDKEDSYKSYAKARAGVSLDGKDDDYFTNIGLYLNTDEYNHDVSKNREFHKLYNGEEYYWNWQNPSDRKVYRNLWKSSEEAYNNVRFVVGALLINRIISGIYALRSAVRYNNKLENDIKLSVGFKKYDNLPSTINLNITKSF